MPAGLSGRILAGLAFLAAIHAAAHAELLPVPFWVLVVVISMVLIYVGSLYSLAVSTYADEVGEGAMTQKDAMTMPLTAGAVLVALYVSYKYLPENAINIALRVYFFALGTVAVGSMAGWILEAAGKQAGVVSRAARVLELPLGMGGVNSFGIMGLVVGAAVAGLEVYAKVTGQPWHWILNNAVGAAFCFEALGRLSLGRVSTGMLLLAGLFVYDIFMVFGTKSILGEGIMQSVAAKVDGPILLLFPDHSARNPDDTVRFSKLGLGDICFPGAFIALLLRYDAFRAGAWFPPAATPSASQTEALKLAAASKPDDPVPDGLPGGAASFSVFPAWYFVVALASYLVGLAVTLVIMLVFKHPQPALLYLSPACILAAAGTAQVLGDVSALFKYSEEEEEEQVAAVVEEAPAGAAKADDAKIVAEDGDTDSKAAPVPAAEDAPTSGGARRRARRFT